MIGGGPAFPAGLAMAAHGEYGMANSIIGINNALNGTSNPGVAEYVGGALAGQSGANAGAAIDLFGNLSGGVRESRVSPTALGWMRFKEQSMRRVRLTQCLSSEVCVQL